MRRLILVLTLVAFVLATLVPSISMAAAAAKSPYTPVGKAPAKPAAKPAVRRAPVAKKVKKKKKKKGKKKKHHRKHRRKKK